MGFNKYHIFSLIILFVLIFFAVNYDNIFDINLPISNETLESLGTNGESYNNLISVDFDKEFINNKSGINLTEFSDFECPFCKDSYPLVKLILYQYNGKINYKYVHFGGHPNTIKAALASECAREQNKFWAYHDLLFEKQNKFNDKFFKQLAEQLNLNTQQFNDCYNTQKYIDLVKNDFQTAQKLGVIATPTYLLNGEEVFLDEIPNKLNLLVNK